VENTGFSLLPEEISCCHSVKTEKEKRLGVLTANIAVLTANIAVLKESRENFVKKSWLMGRKRGNMKGDDRIIDVGE